MFNSIKEKIKNKKEEKTVLKKLKKEEKELEKEISASYPEEEFSLFNTFKLLKEKDEEEVEYESYLTKEELEELNKEKKFQKKVIIIAASAISILIISISTFTTLFYNANKSDLYKVTEPLLKEYYKEKYNKNLRVKSIEELIAKDENDNEIASGIYLLTTNDDKHIMSVNNTLIGDDIDTAQQEKEVLSFIDSYLPDLNSITSLVDLSYKDYYLEFNRYIDYINVIPGKMTTEELINSEKLTVTYKAVYQGFVNESFALNLINNFSDDSVFYFLKQELGGITNVKIITKEKIISLDVTAQIPKDDNIIYYELDRNKNNITDIMIKKYSNTSIKVIGNYDINNPISITYENNNDENKENIYLLRFPSSLINKATYVELDTNKNNELYKELRKNNYSDIILIEISSYTYLIGKNEVLIGKKVEKNSTLCNLGLC